MAKTADREYDASGITVLEGLEAVRTRPGMYIGGTDSHGLSHLLWEVVDNAVDEAAEGHGDCIEITFHTDGSYSVLDNGRGIPVGEHSNGQSALEVVFMNLHAGGKFGTDSYGASGGLHGVGVSVVNAMSERLHVEVTREGSIHRLDFENQTPGQRDDKTGKFAPGSELRRVGRAPAKRTGTWVRFWPDQQIFADGATVAFPDACLRAKQASWLTPGVTFVLSDERSGETVTECAAGGLADAVDMLAGSSVPVSPTLTFCGTHSFVESVMTGGAMTDVERDCRVEIALRWVDSATLRIVSFVNTIPTPDGGRHRTGFERGLSQEIRKQVKAADLRKLRKLKAAGGTAQFEDAAFGLVAVVRVVIPEPEFEGQTKRRLSTSQAEKMVLATVRESLAAWFSKTSKHSRAVLNHVADAMIARHAAQEAKDMSRKARKATSGSLPAELADCRMHPDGELLIVEGKSAAGPAKRARDSDWQAVLPLRGKIVNAAKEKPATVVANNEVSALVSAIGAGAGSDFDLGSARYERIVLLADADVDGSHIRCLLLTLIWEQMRSFAEAGRVYAADPPTHAITVTSSNEKLFVYSPEDLAAECASLDKAGRKHRVTRFKGLGEMDDDELAATTLNPKTRRLRRVTTKDMEACAEAVQVMMGGEVAPRREFIVTHSAEYGHALDI